MNSWDRLCRILIVTQMESAWNESKRRCSIQPYILMDTHLDEMYDSYTAGRLQFDHKNV